MGDIYYNKRPITERIERCLKWHGKEKDGEKRRKDRAISKKRKLINGLCISTLATQKP